MLKQSGVTQLSHCAGVLAVFPGKVNSTVCKLNYLVEGFGSTLSEGGRWRLLEYIAKIIDSEDFVLYVSQRCNL